MRKTILEKGRAGIESIEADDIIEKGYKEYGKYLQQFVDKLDDNYRITDLVSIFEDFGAQVTMPNLRKAAAVLSDTVGVETPTINYYVDPNKKPCFAFSKKSNEIKIIQPEYIELQELLSRSKAIEMLAHEIWHSHQRDLINNGDKRAELYKEKYDKDNHTVEEYINNPSEVEAFIFGIMVRNKYNKQRIKWLKRERERTIGALASIDSDSCHLSPEAKFNEKQRYLNDNAEITRKMEELREEEGDIVYEDEILCNS